MKFSGARRRFLLSGAAVGGGLLVGYGLFKPRDLLGDRRVLAVGDGETALNAWLKIALDGQVTVAVPRAEMGQGVYTALPMLVAEELDVPWEQVRVEQAPIAKVYGNIAALVASLPMDDHDQGWLAEGGRWGLARVARILGVQVTGGSTSVSDAWLPMRTAGAAARDMLIRAAAARLEVHPKDLSAADGLVRHAASGRSLSYGALAAEAAELTPTAHPDFKAAKDYRFLGKPVPRLDVPDKCTGAAVFGIDVHDAELRHASIRIAPVFGGRLAHVDRDALAKADGVEAVVVEDDAVAVVAHSWWQAEQALLHANLRFEDGPHAAASTTTLFADYARALDEGAASVYEERGAVDDELDGDGVITAEYRVPLLAHACMEPMNCTARVSADRAEIWCGNQAPDLLRLIAADFLQMEPEQVSLHSPLLGGGFGRRGEADVLRRALAIARAVPGRTVKLTYSREQDLQHDTYRPPVLSRFRARLAADGSIHAWHNQIASPSVSQAVLGRAFPHLPLGGPDRTNVEGAAWLAYRVPHRRVEHAMCPLAVPVGFWRSVGHSYNAFFTECFIDELARAAGRDPLAFRLAHLAADTREHRVLSILQAVSDWEQPLPDGQARGIAVHESFGAVVGQCAEVAIVAHEVRVARVVCVVDCGRVINPDTVMAQMESGIVFGLTAALYGEVPYEQGRIKLHNFSDYRMLGLARMPRIEVHVIDSERPPGGVGEPGTPPIAPAVANAVAHLTGQAVRALPVRV